MAAIGIPLQKNQLVGLHGRRFWTFPLCNSRHMVQFPLDLDFHRPMRFCRLFACCTRRSKSTARNEDSTHMVGRGAKTIKMYSLHGNIQWRRIPLKLHRTVPVHWEPWQLCSQKLSTERGRDPVIEIHQFSVIKAQRFLVLKNRYVNGLKVLYLLRSGTYDLQPTLGFHFLTLQYPTQANWWKSRKKTKLLQLWEQND